MELLKQREDGTDSDGTTSNNWVTHDMRIHRA
jgi:hypothetical protein